MIYLHSRYCLWVLAADGLFFLFQALLQSVPVVERRSYARSDPRRLAIVLPADLELGIRFVANIHIS